MARGDRRLSSILELTRYYGDTVGIYKRAFKEIPELDYYVHQDWKTHQTFTRS